MYLYILFCTRGIIYFDFNHYNSQSLSSTYQIINSKLKSFSTELFFYTVSLMSSPTSNTLTNTHPRPTNYQSIYYLPAQSSLSPSPPIVGTYMVVYIWWREIDWNYHFIIIIVFSFWHFFFVGILFSVVLEHF